MAPLAAKGPVLVHFFDFSQLNSVRTLPYVDEWNRRYREFGLRVIGVQAPRFPFGADPEPVEAGLERLGVEFPVLIDGDLALWHMYGCEGWPSLFLWGRGGILRWFHFGEGDYAGTEEAIQQSLLGPDAEPNFPDPMEPVRPTDAEGYRSDRAGRRTDPDRRPPLDEVRRQRLRRRIRGRRGPRDRPPVSGALVLALDGEPVGQVAIDGAGLYTLAEHERHGSTASRSPSTATRRSGR